MVGPPAAGARPIVFVTGGTGLVGARLVRELEALFPESVVVIATRSGDPTGRVTTQVFADVQLPGLGMKAADADALRRRVAVIVHAAANTRFNAPLEESRRANCLGTRHVLDFAL